MSNKGMLVVISGPSGSGKDTVVSRLTDGRYALSVSVTTRAKREREQEGEHYFFRSKEEFERMKNNGELLEHAVFCDNCYGTPRAYVEERIAEGKAVLLEIDVQGALQIKEKFADSVLIFLMTPTLGELRRRLTARKTEGAEALEKRMKRAYEEVGQLGKYDYLVINDEVERAVERINAIVQAESLRPRRCGEAIAGFGK